MSQSVSIKNQLGNTLNIHFVYPEVNPKDFVDNISDALFYAGVFDGFIKSDTSTSQTSKER